VTTGRALVGCLNDDLAGVSAVAGARCAGHCRNRVGPAVPSLAVLGHVQAGFNLAIFSYQDSMSGARWLTRLITASGAALSYMGTSLFGISTARMPMLLAP
jgi:predicted benzoate:H+ symporter BenE